MSSGPCGPILYIKAIKQIFTSYALIRFIFLNVAAKISASKGRARMYPTLETNRWHHGRIPPPDRPGKIWLKITHE